jgi:hypothetical protein
LFSGQSGLFGSAPCLFEAAISLLAREVRLVEGVLGLFARGEGFREIGLFLL